MSQSVATRSVIVANTMGLHLRAATMIAVTARRFAAKVEVVKGPLRVDATEVLQLSILGADCGTALCLEATGRDAEPALEAIEQLFIRKFDED
jgi:phosphotransferase system HPr (HPr) family protein